MGNKELQSGTWVVALEPKKIKGMSLLTLYGFPETYRSVSFSHPWLDFVTGNKWTGKRGRRRRGRRRRVDLGQWRNLSLACFSKSQIYPRLVSTGVVTLSRDRHSLPGHRVALLERIAITVICFFLTPAPMPKVVSRAAVSTSQDGSCQHSERRSTHLIPVDPSAIHSFVSRKLPRLL